MLAPRRWRKEPFSTNNVPVPSPRGMRYKLTSNNPNANEKLFPSHARVSGRCIGRVVWTQGRSPQGNRTARSKDVNRRKKTDQSSIVHLSGDAGALQLPLALFEMAVCVRLGVSSEVFLTKHLWVTMVHCSTDRSFEIVCLKAKTMFIEASGC